MSYRCRGWSTTRNDRCEHLVREPDGWCRQCSETRPAGGGPAVSRLKHQASLLDADDVGRTGEIDIEQLAASLPVETFEVLYHVGTMDPTDKGRVCQSLEGDGLSVSVDPDDWRAIAELGGDPQWALTKPGNRLLGIHELSEGQRAGIREWAVNEGWLEPATLWQVSYTDTEVEDRRSMVFDDKEQAQGEFDEKREWEPDSEPEMTQVEGAAATAKLRQRVMNSCPPGSAEEYAQLVFAVDIAGMDGVWWADRYAPAELSCPRGVIAPHALSSFRVARDEHSGVADDLYPHLDEIAAIASGWEPDWDEVFEGAQHDWCGNSSRGVVAYLAEEGIEAETLTGGLRGCYHTWVELGDGTIIDPSIAQYIDRTDETTVDAVEVPWLSNGPDGPRVAVVPSDHPFHAEYEPGD